MFSIKTEKTFLILFSILLQIQVCHMVNGHFFNFSPSDLLIGFLFIFLPFTRWQFVTQKMHVIKKEKSIPWVILCIVALTISYGLGTQDTWSLVKYFGFYILIIYYFMGLLIGESTKNKELFPVWFIIFFTITSIIYLLIQSVFGLSLLEGILRHPQHKGLVGNPNIFSFLGCITLCFHFSYINHRILKGHFGTFLLFFEFFTIFLTASRAGWLCGVCILFYSLITRTINLKKLCIPILLLISYTNIIHFYKPVQAYYSENLLIIPLSINNRNLVSTKEYSLKDRVMIFEDSLALIKEKPIFGHGLGTALKKYTTTFGHPNIIHNTLLWLLVETGFVGAFCFLGLFFSLLRRFYKDMRETKDPFSQSCFMILLAFAIFSLFHEMMYQRILWFILGLGIANLKRSKATPAP